MKLSILEHAILSTIIYYEALGRYPLTSFEIHGRLNKIDFHPTFLEIVKSLEGLVQRKIIAEKNGFFYIYASKKPTAARRIKRYKISEEKWRIAKKALEYLRYLPFIRMIGITGSLAINNARDESDVDLFVVTRPGRIWTSRILCSFVTQVLGIRRYEDNIKNRICLSHYVSSGALTLRVKNLSKAHTYAGLVPLFDKNGWYKKFQEQNMWMKKYLSFYPWKLGRSKRYLKKSYFSRIISSFLEFVLENRVGDMLEKVLHRIQERKILAKISPTHKPAENKLILSDDVLMFHYPVSRNEEIEREYRKIMHELKVREKN